MRRDLVLWGLMAASFGGLAGGNDKHPQAVGQETDEPVYRRLYQGDPDAVAETEKNFREAKSRDDRGLLAFQIVHSGNDHEGIYFEYLFNEARAAIEQSMPFPFELDDESLRLGKYSRAFQDWCAEHGKSPEIEADRAASEFPRDVARLARTQNPAAFDLLLKGLKNPNLWIAAAAARGLGRIGNARAIEPMLEALNSWPPQTRQVFVQGLVYFDDPRVRKAVAEIVGSKDAFDEWRAVTVRE